MKYTEAIKNGFRLINKNWQLVLVQVAAMLVGFIGFFILVGIPLAIAFIIFGLDLTELSRMGDVLRTLHRPAEILSRYFGIVLFILASILFYILAVFSLWVFVIGGSIGVVARSIRDGAARFHLKVFLAEGRRLFLPLIGFTTVIGAIFIVLAFALGIVGGAIAAIVSATGEQEATLALFLGIFFTLVLVTVGLILILVTLAVTIFGFAAIAVKGFGPLSSLKEAFLFLYRHSGAFYLYCLVFGGYVVVSFTLIMLGYPLRFVPLLGHLLAAVTVQVGQSYLGLVMLATIFWYYSLAEAAPAGESRVVGKSAESYPISGGSTPEKDISAIQAQTQGDAPPEKDLIE